MNLSQCIYSLYCKWTFGLFPAITNKAAMATKWMDLEDIMLRDMSVTEGQILTPLM